MKKVFVHIPKTAGSYINNSIKAAGFSLLSHCESCIDSPTFGDAITDYEWVSGHVNLQKFVEIFYELHEEAYYFSILRNPIKQLISQICWQIEICSKSNDNHLFMRDHPAHSRLVMLKVLFSGLSNTKIISQLLNEHKGYLTNNQAVTLLGGLGINLSINDLPPYDQIKYFRKFQLQCFEVLQSFAYIGSDSDIDGCLASFGMKNLSTKNEIDMNKSSLYIDPQILKSTDCVKELIDHQILDCVLYACHAELKFGMQGKILDMSSMDALKVSLFEYISPGLNFSSKAYDRNNLLKIQESIAACLGNAYR